MTKRMDAKEARNRFADLVGSVHDSGEAVIVEQSGKPMVAVIPVEIYQALIAEREARFAVVDRIRSRLTYVPDTEVEADVVEAVTAVRSAGAQASW